MAGSCSPLDHRALCFPTPPDNTGSSGDAVTLEAPLCHVKPPVLQSVQNSELSVKMSGRGPASERVCPESPCLQKLEHQNRAFIESFAIKRSSNRLSCLAVSSSSYRIANLTLSMSSPAPPYLSFYLRPVKNDISSWRPWLGEEMGVEKDLSLQGGGCWGEAGLCFSKLCCALNATEAQRALLRHHDARLEQQPNRRAISVSKGCLDGGAVWIEHTAAVFPSQTPALAHSCSVVPLTAIYLSLCAPKTHRTTCIPEILHTDSIRCLQTFFASANIFKACTLSLWS
ncbi:hypothetical protein PO909_014248 [Leuciscus waleckii]